LSVDACRWVDEINRMVDCLMLQTKFGLYLSVGTPFVRVNNGARSYHFLDDWQ
jgi:hypothetical protein